MGVTLLVGRSRGSCFEQGCRIGFNSQLQQGLDQARQNILLSASGITARCTNEQIWKLNQGTNVMQDDPHPVTTFQL